MLHVQCVVSVHCVEGVQCVVSVHCVEGVQCVVLYTVLMVCSVLCLC